MVTSVVSEMGHTGDILDLLLGPIELLFLWNEHSSSIEPLTDITNTTGHVTWFAATGSKCCFSGAFVELHILISGLFW